MGMVEAVLVPAKMGIGELCELDLPSYVSGNLAILLCRRLYDLVGSAWGKAQFFQTRWKLRISPKIASL